MFQKYTINRVLYLSMSFWKMTVLWLALLYVLTICFKFMSSSDTYTIANPVCSLNLWLWNKKIWCKCQRLHSNHEKTEGINKIWRSPLVLQQGLNTTPCEKLYIRKSLIIFWLSDFSMFCCQGLDLYKLRAFTTATRHIQLKYVTVFLHSQVLWPLNVIIQIL